MSHNCPLCGARVYKLSALRWRDALSQMPGPMKLDAIKQLTSQSKPAADGRWLYATKNGSAVVASPGQMHTLLNDDGMVYGEQLED